MKLNHAIGLALLTASVSISVAQATNINLPDGNMEGLSSVIYPPLLLGSTKGYMGAWSVEMSGLLSLGGHVETGTAGTLNGPAAPVGTNELDIDLPASVLVSASISQVLTNTFYQPNSTYRLSVELDPSSAVGLLNGASLNLNAGGSTLASLSGATLVSLFTGPGSYQTVALTYKTGNSVPTNAVGVALAAAGLASVAGHIYVDNFQLSVVPTQVQMAGASSAGGTNVVLNGSGGAPYATYEILSCTNPIAPMSAWVPAVTNQFDANGNFTVSFKINVNAPQRFFRLVMPE